MRLFVFGVLCGVVLVACGSESTSEPQAVFTPTATAQPTLDLDQIPVLGENPVPPVPLAATDPRFPIEAADAETLEAGKALYDHFCAACHGIDGTGQQPDPLAPGAAPPHNAEGHTWHHADQQNFLTVWQGSIHMPGFYKRLTPDEIISILAYIKTWWLPDQVEHQIEQTQLIASQ